MRHDGRRADELRPVNIIPGFVSQADGSALIEVGGTRVICTASIESGVPGWREGSGLGWLTAEYGMLPASTGRRRHRDVSRGRLDGRSTEIQRLIGRSLRAVFDPAGIGERTLWLDCDVLEADGGTRCASICGGFVAAQLALGKLDDLPGEPFRDSVAAVSVGLVDGTPVLDLDYTEDSAAQADVNVIMTGGGDLIEVQATGEGATFTRDQLTDLLDLAAAGVSGLTDHQNEALA
ncbi:MAG: ribonuclease PH [Thermoleophilia bacterium]|nr:ribonuclease PH [Thermoleophilia bacterium]MDH3724491.1 ribonuclease PH [Thermoleophilia bacterium]